MCTLHTPQHTTPYTQYCTVPIPPLHPPHADATRSAAPTLDVENKKGENAIDILLGLASTERVTQIQIIFGEAISFWEDLQDQDGCADVGEQFFNHEDCADVGEQFFSSFVQPAAGESVREKLAAFSRNRKKKSAEAPAEKLQNTEVAAKAQAKPAAEADEEVGSLTSQTQLDEWVGCVGGGRLACPSASKRAIPLAKAMPKHGLNCIDLCAV